MGKREVIDSREMTTREEYEPEFGRNLKGVYWVIYGALVIDTVKEVGRSNYEIENGQKSKYRIECRRNGSDAIIWDSGWHRKSHSERSAEKAIEDILKFEKVRTTGVLLQTNE